MPKHLSYQVKEIMTLGEQFEKRAIKESSKANQSLIIDNLVAYDYYRKLAVNKQNDKVVRGNAAFRMWRLAKDDKVPVVDSKDQLGNIIFSKLQKIQRCLLWAKAMGSQDAAEEEKKQSMLELPRAGSHIFKLARVLTNICFKNSA